MQATPDDLKRFAHITPAKRRIYCAMVYRLDQNIGKILKQVRDQGIERDTFIIFLSDNGGPSSDNGSLNAPFRGVKTTVLEGGIRVPMIFKWPALLPAGKTIDDTVSSLDILPTCISAAGHAIEPSVKLTGVNLLPLLTNKTTTPPHSTLFWNYTVGSAIRSGDWKLIRLPDRLPMLYHLAEDAAEEHNLATAEPDRTRDLLKELGLWELHSPNPVFREPSSWRVRHLNFYDLPTQTTQPD